MISRTAISGIILLFVCASCTKLKVPSGYIMDETSLKDSLRMNDKNLVLFWTDWCGASNHRIKNLYLPLNKKIEEQGINLKIMLLASDSNISLKEIDELRDKGISCYYIDQPGGIAITNRIAIKKFINTAFPDNEIERIKGLLYGIPVELLVTQNLEIVNEKETGKSYEYIKQILEPEE